MSTPTKDDQNFGSGPREYAAKWQHEVPPLPPAPQLDPRSPHPAFTSDVPPSVPRLESELRHRVAVERVGLAQISSRWTTVFTWIGRLLMVVALAALVMLIVVMTQAIWRGSDRPRDQATQ